MNFGHLHGTVHVGHLEDDPLGRFAKELGVIPAGFDRFARVLERSRHANDAALRIKRGLGQSPCREGLFNLRRLDGAVHFRHAHRNRRNFALRRLFENEGAHAELFHFPHEFLDAGRSVRDANASRRIVAKNFLHALDGAQSFLHSPTFDGTAHFLDGQNGDHQTLRVVSHETIFQC